MSDINSLRQQLNSFGQAVRARKRDESYRLFATMVIHANKFVCVDVGAER